MGIGPLALQNKPRLLVVDGFLTNASDSTNITLTRSRNISDSTSSLVESNATLMTEAVNSVAVPLKEIGYPDSLTLKTWWE
jgi:hypothetical protein